MTASTLSWPEPLAQAAYHGIAGEFVRLMEPHTEADPAAVLVTFLTGFGNAIGRGPHWKVNGVEHATNLYAQIVGRTSAGRKGTAVGDALLPLKQANPEWATRRTISGLSTGEGLVHQVRDPVEKINEEGEPEITDGGVLDKRLMVIEPEFSQALKVMAREGNTLSPIVRGLWDGGDVGTVTKTNPSRTSGALVSIVGQISAEELRKQLRDVEIANGFVNRFLIVCAKRSKRLSRGGNVDLSRIGDLADRLRLLIDIAGSRGELGMTGAAWEKWDREYEQLTSDRPGLHGAVCARGHAQVRRLAVIYALLDRKQEVDRPHLLAALEVWRYCEDSARYVFGDQVGDRRADRLRAAIREAGAPGLARSEFRAALGTGNVSAEEIDQLLMILTEAGLIETFTQKTAGRSQERWRLVGMVEMVTKPPDLSDLPDHNDHNYQPGDPGMALEALLASNADLRERQS